MHGVKYNVQLQASFGYQNTVPTHMCSFISKMCVQKHIIFYILKNVDMQFLKL